MENEENKEVLVEQSTPEAEVAPTLEVTEPKEQMEAIQVGKIQEEKKGNYLGLIIFFIILIGVVIGLPYIQDYFSKDEKEASPANNNPSNQNNNQEESTLEEKPTHIDSATFMINDLEFSDFKVSKGEDFVISFVVGTSKDAGVSLGNTDLYLELYSDNKTLLERVKISRGITITKSTPLTLEFNISQNSFNNTTNLLMIEKKAEDYPNITLNKDGDGSEILICVNNNNNITYYFNESKLQKVENNNTYYKGDNIESYLNLLNNKKNETIGLNAREGFTSEVSEFPDGTGFKTNTMVTFDKATLSALDLVLYYHKDTLAKVVAFEMEARRYNCN